MFPTLHAAPFVVNRLLPRRMATRVLACVRSDRRTSFPAFYQWCRGPIPRQFERFRSLGYEVEAYHGFFGHSYWARLPRLDALERRLTGTLLLRPSPWLTSYAVVVLRTSGRLPAKPTSEPRVSSNLVEALQDAHVVPYPRRHDG